MREKQHEVWSIMGEILQEDLLNLHAKAYRLQEDFSEGTCDISLIVKNLTTGESLPIEGRGVGLVDAVFNGLKDRMVDDYPSLDSISFTSFELKGLMGSGNDSHSDAEAVVSVGVNNSYGNTFIFESTSRSIGQACIQATVNALEYFANSERTFVKLYQARQHYEAENRTELVDKYTALMARMVDNTSYSEVIEKIKSIL